MYTIIITVVAVALRTSALPFGMPEPGDLALLLDEDEFEDYLDAWLGIEELSWRNISGMELRPHFGCSMEVNGDFSEPQPIFIDERTNTYLSATGNTGFVNLDTKEKVIVSCPGSNRRIVHPLALTSLQTGTIQCVNNAKVMGRNWFEGVGSFSQLKCSSNPVYEAIATGETCFGNATVIRSGFNVDDVFHPLYMSCFDENRLEVLYVNFNMNSANAVHQVNVKRPSWKSSTFYPGVSVSTAYTKTGQRSAISKLVGKTLADAYVTNSQYLARGHLAAKTDYVFASGQRTTFFYINAIPQWQPFNAGNWNWLEQNLRKRIGETGYEVVIYTGAFGVTQLRNEDGDLVDVYLIADNKLPVPQYMYKRNFGGMDMDCLLRDAGEIHWTPVLDADCINAKIEAFNNSLIQLYNKHALIKLIKVVYDASRRLGTAFISINNPYYTIEEARAMQFCSDQCRNNTAFNWLKWQPDRMDIGYSFCCTIDDFRRQIPHLPEMIVHGLLS